MMRSRWAPTTVDHTGFRIHIAPKTIPGVAFPGRMLSRGTSIAPRTVIAMMIVDRGASCDPWGSQRAEDSSDSDERKRAPISAAEAPRSRAITITT